MPKLRPQERPNNVCSMGCKLKQHEHVVMELMLFLHCFLFRIISVITCAVLQHVWSSFTFFLHRSRTCMFVQAFYTHLCARVSVRFWRSIYLSCSLCTRTGSRHAYFLCTWMAIRAALPITIIYIKFEINFTLFFLSVIMSTAAVKPSCTHEF